ncbi:MAG TPA: hypothetical protein PKE06_27250 [Flavilitoribacter sp.]|nr:hypothetical protein [Flavilitoribacter sp.]HMQ89154.1 hypothetical protein [Flavilitoribacter sp.]
MERSAPDRSINTTVPAAGVRPSNDGLAVNNPHFSDNRPEAALMMQFQEMADLAGKQAQRHGYAAAGKAGSGVLQRQRGLKTGDAVLVDLYGDEKGVILEAIGEEYRVKLENLSEARVYTEEFREPPSGKPQKYQALNVERSYNPNPETPDETRTIELRALRAQRSADEFLKIARLFQARLDYLRKQRLAGGKGPAVNIPDLSSRAKSQNTAIRAAFKTFLQPTGLNQGDYSGMVEENLKER